MIEGDIVLDFFAGSGSVAHATIELTNDDSIQRYYICVQVPEIIDEKKEAYKLGFRTISEVCKTRIKRATMAIQKANSSVDLGYKVFKLRKSHYKSWQDYERASVAELESKIDLFETPLIEGWDIVDLVTEIFLLEGFTLDSTIEKSNILNNNQIFHVSSEFCEHSLQICLDTKIDELTIKELRFNENDVFVCLDSAITDQVKMRLADICKLKTI